MVKSIAKNMSIEIKIKNQNLMIQKKKIALELILTNKPDNTKNIIISQSPLILHISNITIISIIELSLSFDFLLVN